MGKKERVIAEKISDISEEIKQKIESSGYHHKNEEAMEKLQKTHYQEVDKIGKGEAVDMQIFTVQDAALHLMINDAAYEFGYMVGFGTAHKVCGGDLLQKLSPKNVLRVKAFINGLLQGQSAAKEGTVQ